VTYDDLIEATPREKRIARWLAGGIHVAFVLLLILGVTWQRQPSAPAIAELWSSLPPVRKEAPPPPKVEPRPEPKPEPKPEAKPEPKPPEKPKVEPKPLPKPEVKPAPKPDIALKEKLEKEKKLKEQKELEQKKRDEEKRKQAELERKKEEEKRKQAELERRKEEDKRRQKELEARKLEEEKKRIEKERLAKEAEEKALARERQAIADRLAREQAAAQRAVFDKYVTQIQNHVRRQIVEPPNLQGNPQVEFDVVLIPGGEVLSVRLSRSSGNQAYDAAVERAILKASPLPLPPDPGLFQQFRELKLQIRPRQ
jgi:colicin import membrane protein